MPLRLIPLRSLYLIMFVKSKTFVIRWLKVSLYLVRYNTRICCLSFSFRMIRECFGLFSMIINTCILACAVFNAKNEKDYLRSEKKKIESKSKNVVLFIFINIYQLILVELYQRICDVRLLPQ